jgi:hypothetical protein
LKHFTSKLYQVSVNLPLYPRVLGKVGLRKYEQKSGRKSTYFAPKGVTYQSAHSALLFDLRQFAKFICYLLLILILSLCIRLTFMVSFTQSFIYGSPFRTTVCSILKHFSQSCGKRLLVSSRPSICPPVCTQQLGSCWGRGGGGLAKFCFEEFLVKSANEIKFLLK